MPARHVNTGRWRIQLIEPRHRSFCGLCRRPINGSAYLGHGVPFCVPCVERRTGEVDNWITWARAQRSRNE